MTIANKIRDIRKYLKSIIFRNNQPLIEIGFKSTWKISEDINPKIEYGSVNDKTDSVVFFTKDTTLEIDDIIDEVIKVVRYNLDEERKQDLFNKKMDELKSIFSNSTYDDLVDLNFVTDSHDNATQTEVKKELQNEKQKS